MKKVAYIFLLISFLSKAGTPSIIFKENKGQWPSKVLFGAEFLNTKFYINKNSFNYCVYNYEEILKARGNRRSDEKNSIVHGHNYEVSFVGGDLNSFETKNKLTEYYNYFLGNDKSKWISNVKTCKLIEFKNVYEGISLNVYSNEVNLKYDFIISPNTNPDLIKLNYKYADRIEIRNNELVIKTSIGEIIEKAPFAYQIIKGVRKEVKCKYVLLENNTIGFSFPQGYDKNYELVIDPTVVVCSYSGTSVFSYCHACTYDPNGNIYTVGGSSLGYPVTTGAFQVNPSGTADIVVSAYNSIGTVKLFSTFLGGSVDEYVLDIHVSNNEITLLGVCFSPDYPFTKNAFDTILNGTSDLMITKLDITGSNLIASTFIGGSLQETVYQFALSGWATIGGEMVFDAQENIYVTSNTKSPDFPTTPGAISSTLSGTSDAVIFKIDSALSNLLWSTYLGGTGLEDGASLKTDGGSGVYLLGTTSSTNFPTTSAAYNTVKNSPNLSDMYISHINPTGTALIASTYVGTVTEEVGYLLDLDPSNNVYVCGHISSSSFLVPSAGTYSMANTLNTIYKLDSSLSNLGFKTKFGTIAGTNPRLYYTAFKVDSCQNIYLAGMAYAGYPTTPDQFQPFGGGSTDMYMIVFNANCSSIRFASYYGGNAPAPNGFNSVGEQAFGISHFDTRGKLYLAISASENLPTTPGAYCANYSNTTTVVRIYNDAFLKVDLGTFVNAYSSYGPTIIGCPPFTTQFVSTTNTGSSYWDLGDGTTTTSNTITHTYNNLGTYNVLLVVTDTNTCNKKDSIKSILNIINPTAFDLGKDAYLCPGIPLLLKANVAAVSYSWSTGQTFPNIYVNKPGTYTLTINNGGCNSSDEITVMIGEEKLSEHFPNVITPNGDNVNDFIDFKLYSFAEMEFTLYDRWGKEHYKIKDSNGKLEPNNLNDGTYFYVINYKSYCTEKHGTAKGFISIFK